MQFLAARSLWMNFTELRYSIPCATSKHILVRMNKLVPYKKNNVLKIIPSCEELNVSCQNNHIV